MRGCECVQIIGDERRPKWRWDAAFECGGQSWVSPVGGVRDGVWITSPSLSAGRPSIEHICSRTVYNLDN